MVSNNFRFYFNVLLAYQVFKKKVYKIILFTVREALTPVCCALFYMIYDVLDLLLHDMWKLSHTVSYRQWIVLQGCIPGI